MKKYIKQIGILFLTAMTFINIELCVKEVISCYHYCIFYSKVPVRIPEIENKILIGILFIAIFILSTIVFTYIVIRHCVNIYKKYYK